MKTSNLGFIRLNQASLCLDCEMITAETKTCAVCGSSALMNVARILGQPMHLRRLTVERSDERHETRQVFFSSHRRISGRERGLACLQGE
jgi:hypothetical protein